MTNNSNGNVGTIYLRLAVDDSSFNRDVNRAGQSAGDAMTGAFSGAIGKIGKMFVAAFALNKVKDFMKSAIDSASDLVEVQNVVDTAFGSMAYKAEEFASIASESFGISATVAKRASGTYMAMADGMGIAAENASTMSVNVAKLAADVSSFYNLNYDEAETKLKGIFTGETEGLKSLGVVMTETNLEAFRLSQGIEKTYKEMTAAEKTTLRYKFVMDTLQKSQGDFAKTSDGWANSVRQLQGRWEQFATKIGTTAIQYLTPALNILKDFVGVLNTLADDLGLGKIEEDIANDAASIGDSISEEIEAGAEEGKKAMLGLVGMDEIQKLGSTKSPLEEAAEAAAAWMSVDEYVDVTTDKQENRLLRLYETIKTKALDIKEKYLKPLFDWGLKQVEKFRPVVEKAFRLIKKIATDVGDALRKFWEEHGDSIRKIVENNIEFIRGLLSNIFDGLLYVWENGGRDLFISLKDFIGEIYDITAKIWEVLQPIVSGMFAKAIENVANIVGFLLETLSGVLDAVTGLAEITEGLVTGDTGKTSAGQAIAMRGVQKMPGAELAAGLIEKATGKEVPRFAAGGIVSGPTLAYVGEYTGAKSNPEVVAPLSDLKEILAESMNGGNLGHLTVNIGGKTVADVTSAQINKQTRRRNNNTVISIN